MFKSIAAKFVKLQRTSAYFLAFLINICLLMAQIPLYFLLSLFSSRIYSESLEFSSICVWVTWPDEFVQSFLWQLMAAMFEIQFCCPRLPVLSSQKPGGWELAENQYLFLQRSDSQSETKYQLTLHFMLHFMGHFHARSGRYLNISKKVL